MTRIIRHIRRSVTTEMWMMTWNDGESSATSPPTQIAYTIVEWIEKQDTSFNQETAELDGPSMITNSSDSTQSHNPIS
jgi:hypothetical protein